MKKKISVLLAVLLIMSMIPQTVLAASEEDTAGQLLLDDQSFEDDDTDLFVLSDEETFCEGIDEKELSSYSDETGQEDKTGSELVNGYTEADFEYEDNATGVTITRFKGQDVGPLNIPSVLGQKPVTAIGAGVFENRRGFSGKLVIPDSITVIGNDAFSDCTGFTGLVLPARVERIGWCAFAGCTAMVGNLTIPASVTEFGFSAFEGCRGFTSLTLSPGLTVLGESTFSRCAGITNPITLPDGIGVIPSSCFFGCSGIPSVSMNAGSELVQIDSFAFERCTGIKSLQFGNNIKSIGYESFYNCTGLGGTLVFPNSVTQIGDSAFDGCSSITGIVLSQNLEKLGVSAFANCSSIQGVVTVPKSITDFGSNAFYRAGSGATLVLAEGLKELGSSAFYESGFKGTITIPASMTSIANSAFCNCSQFTSLKLGSNLTTIGYDAFSGCTGLSKTLSIPDTVTTIGDGAFDNCSAFNKIRLSKNLSTIGSNALRDCTGIKEITVPKDVTSISSTSFSGMYFVSKVTNNSRARIYASNFIDNSHGADSYFVNTKTKNKIDRNGMLAKGTFVRKVVKLATPSITGISNGSAGICIECSSSYGASKYIWRRSRDPYKGWKTVGRTSKPVFTDKKAKTGTVYYYRVYVTGSKAKSTESGYKDMCRVKKVTLKSVKGAKGSMSVKWSRNSKADGYCIYYATDKDFVHDQKCVTVRNKNTLSKKITGLKKGQTYYVMVFAYKKIRGTQYLSYRSGIKKVTINK